MARSNCVLFALALRRRRMQRLRQLGVRHPRCYIVLRRSDWGPFPHVLYGERGHRVSYKPASPVKRLVPPPLFVGVVRWGD